MRSVLLAVLLFLPFAQAQTCQRATDCPEDPSNDPCKIPTCVSGQCSIKTHSCNFGEPCLTTRCTRQGVDSAGEYIATCLLTPFTCPPSTQSCGFNACVSQNGRPVCQPTTRPGCFVNGVYEPCRVVNNQDFPSSAQCDIRQKLTKTFGTQTLAPGLSTTLTLRLEEGTPGWETRALVLSDLLPSGLRVASPAGLSANCGPAFVSAVPGSANVLLLGGVLPGATADPLRPGTYIPGVCELMVNVTADNAPGAVINTANLSVVTTLTKTPLPIVYPSLSASASLIIGTGTITISGGAPQSTTVGTPFSQTLKALVKDQNGAAVPGITVTFSQPGTGATGTFAGSVNTAVTDSNGIATSAVFTANNTAGTYNVQATAGTIGSVNFPLTNTPDAPADIRLTSGSGQSTPVRTSFAQPLVATVVDAFGNPVPSAAVRFTAPLFGPGAVFSNNTNTIDLNTNANGQVSALVAANGLVGGPYDATASVVSLLRNIAPRAPGATPRAASSVAFALNNLPNPITVTVNTVPTGPTVSVNNGTPFTGTQTFTAFNQGDPLPLASTSPQPFNGGLSRYLFQSWSDAGTINHTATLPLAATATYTATFGIQHQVTYNVNPPAGGTISPATGFYNQGFSGPVSATANPGYAFAGFTGLLGGTTNPQTLTVTAPGTVTANFVPGDAYHLRYMSNLNLGDSVINLTNTGARGAGLASGTTANITGAICANVYAFSPDEQMVSCCSCPVTPNGLVSLSARADLISNTLTPAVPTSLVVKLVASVPDTANGCANSASNIAVNNLAPGLVAWGTTTKAGVVAGDTQLVETRFAPVTLSIGNGNNIGELSRLQQLCTFINANGSGFGVCRSCRLGGLGGSRQ